MLKTHFQVHPPMSLDKVAACGRGQRLSDSVTRVDCLRCKAQDSYILAYDEYQSAKHAAFEAQTPHTVHNPWANDELTCHNCGGNLFKDLDRDLWTYWFRCVGCGKNQGYPTETGMCQ